MDFAQTLLFSNIQIFFIFLSALILGSFNPLGVWVLNSETTRASEKLLLVLSLGLSVLAAVTTISFLVGGLTLLVVFLFFAIAYSIRKKNSPPSPPSPTSLILKTLKATQNEMKFSFVKLKEEYFKSKISAILTGLALSAVFLTVLLRIIYALSPNDGSDPLYYHLLGPAQWLKHNQITFLPHYPRAFQASLWEGLYLLQVPSLLAKSNLSNTQDLIGMQIAAQLLHTMAGFTGTALVFFLLLKRLNLPKVWALAVTIAALSSPFSHWTSWQAKNEWGVSLWFFTGTLSFLIFLDEQKRSKKPPPFLILMASGILIGSAFSGKFSIFPSVASFFIFITILHLWEGRKEKLNSNIASLIKPGCVFFIFFIIGGLPIYLRNIIYTGDPFFPILSRWIGSAQIGPFLESYLDSYRRSGALVIPDELKRLWDIIKETPSFLIIFALPIFTLLKGRKLFSVNPIFLFMAVSGLLFFLAGAGNSASIRIAAPTSLLISSMGIFALYLIMKAFNLEKNAVVVFITLTAVIAKSYIPFHSVKRLRESLPYEHAVLKHHGGEAKKWLRENAKDELILSTGDNQLYYVSNLNIKVLTEDPKLDRLTTDIKSPSLLFNTLKETGAKYLLDSKYPDGNLWKGPSRILKSHIDSNPDLLLFQSPLSRIIKLN